jgi:hypothetical protein
VCVRETEEEEECDSSSSAAATLPVIMTFMMTKNGAGGGGGGGGVSPVPHAQCSGVLSLFAVADASAPRSSSKRTASHDA